MEKKKVAISDDALDDVSGGKILQLGDNENWKFDINCPFCGEKNELEQGLQMYSSQGGFSIVYCMKCKKPFGFDEKGHTFEVNYKTVE